MDDAIFNDLLKSTKDMVKHARGDITAGWSRPKMQSALLEMLPYLTDIDLEEFIELYKKELERRYEIRRKKDG
tara:strand:+ start:31 stop:249 length:219 start_codon:yes stop_codon:yes gene_type:complete